MDAVERPYLDLTQAIREGRLAEFIAQEEARGVGPAKPEDLDRAIRSASTTITREQSVDRTSRSPSRGGSREKRTR
jgi:hypothetical protein